MERPEERKTMVFITHSIDEAILLGDRIAVMSARPGRIKEILDMPFGRPRDVNAMRADPRFGELRAAHLASAPHGAAAAHAARRGRSREHGRAGAPDACRSRGQRELADDRARAERVAAVRRRRAALQNFGIRMVSLAIFLALWQIAA